MTESELESLEERRAMYRLKAEAAENSAAKAKSKDVALAYSMLAESWTRLAKSVDSADPPGRAPHPQPNGRQAA
jgi:hypothetical protein